MRSRWPKISVVVPSFNHEAFLEETLDSLLSQAYPSLEIIVMDGGSTDGSARIIERFSPHLAHWVSEKDGGQADAIHRGLLRSTGAIQAWLNSDDLYVPGALFHIGEYFKAHPNAEAVFGDMIWIDRDGKTVRMQKEMPFIRFVWLYTYNYIPQPSMFWRRELYERAGGLDTSFELAMDSDLWVRFAALTRIEHTRCVLSKQRFHPGQKTRVASAQTRQREDERAVASLRGPESELSRTTKRILARALRIGWRAATGCYSPSYRPNLDSD